MNFRIMRFIDIYIGVPLVYAFFLLNRDFLHKKKGQKKNEFVKRILLVKFWGIGNVIMLLPSANAVKQEYPEAKIDFLTLKKNKCVSESAAIFDEIYILNNDTMLKFVFTAFRTAFVLRKRKYDLIIDFEQFARFSSLFCALIGKKNRVGFDTTGQHRGLLYTKSIPYNNSIHMTKSFLSLIKGTDVDFENRVDAVAVNYKKEDFEYVRSFLSEFGFSEKDLLMTLHMGTSENFSLRRWPVLKFADLADRLIDKYRIKVIFTGLAEEERLAKEAIRCIKNKKYAIDVCGKFSFSQFVSIIKMSDMIISCDTSTVHIASSLYKAVVGLYGPNTPLLYGPWSISGIYFYKRLTCSPCITNYNAKINKCRNPEGLGACMQKITVDEVLRGIEKNYLEEKAPYRIEKLKNKC